MRLLFLDLDNTLVDRDAAFRAAAVDFLTDQGLPATDLSWLLRIDASGYRPRDAVVRALLDRHPRLARAAAQEFVDDGAASRVTLTDPTRDALRRASAAGWTCLVVTNGRARQQERKLRASGLDHEVAGAAISEAVGVAKPERGIFAAAAASVGGRLDDEAWVVGDSPHADIGGAVALGVRSVWLPLGRGWPEYLAYRPTYTADDVASAVDLILAET